MPPKRISIGRSTREARRKKALLALETDEQRQARLEKGRLRSAQARELQKSRLEVDQLRSAKVCLIKIEQLESKSEADQLRPAQARHHKQRETKKKNKLVSDKFYCLKCQKQFTNREMCIIEGETDDLATISSSVEMNSDEVSTSKDIKRDLLTFSTFEDTKVDLSTSEDTKPNALTFAAYEEDIKPNILTFAVYEDMKPKVSTAVSSSEDIQSELSTIPASKDSLTDKVLKPDVSTTVLFSKERKETELKEKLKFSKNNYQECDICHKQVSDLSTHKQVHSEDKPHECDVCHKRFTKSYQLTRHKMISRKKLFKCDCCHKRFSCRSTSRNNLSKGSFECQVCHKIFARKYHLFKHKKLHPKFNPYYKVFYKYI